MNIEVVTVTNKAPTQPYYIFDKFQESLRRFGVKPTILGWQQPWDGLMTKPRKLKQWLAEERQKSDTLIVCDAWDIVFAKHPEEILSEYREWFNHDGCEVVFNAERSCFPRGDLADKFPDPDTPWRYLNSGFMIGPASMIARIIAHMDLDKIGLDRKTADGSWIHPNDQEHYTLAYLDQPVKMVLDTHCELCQSCSGTRVEEFEFGRDQIFNKITKSYPMAFHFNGGSKQEIMPPVLAKLGL